jgi:hypothetical protein
MKRFALVAAITALAALAIPTLASASPHGRSCGGYTSTVNRGGYTAAMSGFRAGGTMNCPSLRYVTDQWLRRTLSREHGYPTLGGAFFDGYVTWHCHKIGGYHRWQCAEYTSNTWFRFTGTVY